MKTFIIFIIAWKASCVIGSSCFDFITPGYIMPREDQNIKVGGSLNLTCILKNVTSTLVANNLVWKHADRNLNEFVTVINSSAAQLFIPNISESNAGSYYCKINESLKRNETICNIDVNVGYLPLENVGINCTIFKWSEMRCNWKDSIQMCNPNSHHCFQTNWTFRYLENNQWKNCPDHRGNNKTSCTMRGPFLAMHDCFHVELNGTNILKRNVTTKTSFLISKIVILKEPVVTVLSTFTNRAKVRWEVGSPQIYDITCRIRYSCMWPIDNCKEKIKQITIPFTKKLNCHSAMRCGTEGTTYCSKFHSDDHRFVTKAKTNPQINYTMDLEHLYPFSNYTVHIGCHINSTALDTKWDKEGMVQFQTKPMAPKIVPDIVIEDVHELNSKGKYNLTFYWQAVSESSHFGPKFSYEITNGTETWRTENTLLRIPDYDANDSHIFTLKSCNSVNCSISSTYIIAPKTKKDFQPLQVFAAEEISKNKYTISWRTESILHRQNNFVVLSCGKNQTHSLSSVTVSEACTLTSVSGIESVNITLPHSDARYKFAVAMRNETFSSGLTWISCIVEPNNDKRKISIKKFIENTTWVEVLWELHNNCVERRFKGYFIFYREINEMKDTIINISDPFLTSYNLTNLTPNTNYKIKIMVVTDTNNISSADELFKTKNDFLGSHQISGIVVGSVIGAILIFVLLVLISICFVRRMKAKLKELKHIQVPSGLRDGWDLYNRPIISTSKFLGNKTTKLDGPYIIDGNFSPPLSEKIMDGSHSSGFGSDFPGSITSSPSISFSGKPLHYGDSLTDPDTPNGNSNDSVFEYPITTPVITYSQVGRGTSTLADGNQITNPVDAEENDRSLDDFTCSYAKVGIFPPLQEDDLKTVEYVNSDKDTSNADKWSIVDDANSLAKGYKTMAASDLMTQPYVKLALDETDKVKEGLQKPLSKNNLAHFEDENMGDLADVSDPSVPTENVHQVVESELTDQLSPGYVSTNYLTEPKTSSFGMSPQTGNIDDEYMLQY